MASAQLMMIGRTRTKAASKRRSEYYGQGEVVEIRDAGVPPGDLEDPSNPRSGIWILTFLDVDPSDQRLQRFMEAGLFDPTDPTMDLFLKRTISQRRYYFDIDAFPSRAKTQLRDNGRVTVRLQDRAAIFGAELERTVERTDDTNVRP